MNKIKTIFRLLISISLIFGLSSCTSVQIKQVQDKHFSNLDHQRFSKILSETEKILTVSDKKLDKEKIKTRLEGNALTMREGQYDLAAKKYQDGKIDTINFKATVETATKEKNWPRYAMYVSEALGDKSPYLVLLNQANPRDNYKINNWVRLFPDAKIPATNTLNKGIELCSSKNSSLVMQPSDVVSKYISGLNGNKQDAEKFKDDIFNKQLLDEKNKLIDSLRDISDLKIDYKNGNENIALKLNDGSALVFTSFKYDMQFLRGAHKKDGKIAGAIGAILGDNNKIDSDITATYAVSVAFIVPSEKAKDNKIIPVGAQRVLVSVIKK